MVRCSPTEFTEYTEFGSVGMQQGCHTLLHLCSSVSSVGGSSLQEVLCVRCIPWELLHRLLGWCSRDCCTPGLAAWVWQGCHTLLICAHPCHLWESFLCKRFCVFGAFRGSFFTACRLVQQRLLHPLAESTEVVCKSHPFTSNPAFCMSSQNCGYDFVTTCGSLMRSPGNTIAAGANAIAMRWSS